MSRHTPGPWINMIGGPICAYGSVDTISAAVLIPVAVCKPLQDHDSDGREYTLPGCPAANSRLVAAAPDMLAALKGLSGILADIGYFEGQDPHEASKNADSLGKQIISERVKACNAAYAAIRKAEA
jgi:hypothetical protein